ncbi:hypothetical protein GCM10023170_096130 [Phytohabitans houttuyneae]
MPPGEVRLAIDCGSVTTAAVLVWPDGQWQVLRFDDRPVLSSAVFVRPNGRMVAGEDAWQQAVATVEGLFVPSPVRRIREEAISSGAVTVAGVDVVAEPLRQVAQVAGLVVGGPISDVRLVVPAGWGPRRSMLLRQAAHRAGLGMVRLVPAPVAVANLVHALSPVPVGANIAVCDLGGGVAATVLHHGVDGFEVVSSLEDPTAGGLQLDEQVAASLDGLSPPGRGTPADPRWWTLMAAARTAKEQLSAQSAVTVSMPPPQPPTVLMAATVQAQARPLWDRAAVLTADAVEAANLQPAQLAGAYLAGGGAAMPQAAQAVGARLGRAIHTVPDPGVAAARGAAGAAGPPAGAGTLWPVTAWLPDLPLRRLLGVLVPALGSAALLIEFLSVRFRYPEEFVRPVGSDRAQTPAVVMNWGELGLACLLALVACLCGAAVLGAVLPANAGVRRPVSSEAVRMGGGLVVAAILGSFIAALYGVGASVYLVAPLESFLRWALLCTLPLGVVAVCTGVLAAARSRAPAAGWHHWLGFPVLSTIPAAAGMLLVSAANHYMVSGGGPASTVERTGGFLIGIGTGLALVRPLLYRLVVVAPLAALSMAMADIHTTGILAALYVAAVTCWWLQRLWHLRFHPDPWATDA